MCLKYAAAVLSTLATGVVRTVGSLDVVNAQVAARGLQERLLLPFLVVDTVDCIEPVHDPAAMPPRRRAAGRGPGGRVLPHIQTRQKRRNEPRNNGDQATTKPIAVVHKEKPPADVDHTKPTTKTSLIELATYPGYTPSSPTPLPHSLDTLEQMRRVTRAQAKLAAKREGYREYWRENFYSPASQTIFLDTFWWFFLERYQPHGGVQSQLFSRVAENYVKFLMKTEIHTWKDKFLKAYPDAIAQCVYTAFIHAFPASWSSFDANFKSALMEIVYLWQTGTRPMPELWKRWNFDYLDPPDSLKSISQEDDQPRKPAEKTFNLDALVEAERISAEEDAPSISEAKSREEIVESAGITSTPRIHPNSASQHSITRTELEKALTGKLLQNYYATSHGAAGTQKREKTQLDTAFLQYLKLQHGRKKSINPPRGGSPGGAKQKNATTSQKATKLGHNQLLAPSLPSMNARANATVPQRLPQATTKQVNVAPPPPLPQRAPNKTTNGHTSQPQPSQRSDEKRPPPGNQKPHNTTADKTRGSNNPTSSAGRRKYKKINKGKTPQPKEKLRTTTTTPTAATERGKASQGATVRTEKAHEEVGERKTVAEGEVVRNIASDKHQAGHGQPQRRNPQKQETPHQPSTSQTHTTGTTAPAPHSAEKPAGSCKPVSAAEEYGLPNYVFKDGDKETTWKEKAITARKNTNLKPINILHKLHHLGTPLAVPEAESVCFNLFGRSPLVKHYLQKRRLHKTTGYTILTKRTEVNQVIPSGAPTYDDVIRESLRESKERAAHMATQKRQSKKQLQKILQERLKKRETYKRQLRQLLSAQKEVESLSNELVAYWEQRGVDRRVGVASLKHTLSPDMQHNLSNCINKAFQRSSATTQHDTPPHPTQV